MPERVAFISGGSSGIGFGVAQALLEEGFAVTISSRREEKLAAAAERLGAYGEVHSCAANFAEAEEIEAAFASHAERFGQLDLLINNAGVGAAAPSDRLTVRDVDLQLDVNLRAYLLATNSAMPLLKRSSAAQILNISSIAGITGAPGLAAYSASKAGVVGFTKALRQELGPRGVKATAICPAFVDTAMAAWVVDRIGAENMIQVSDVVNVVMTLVRLSPACNVPEVVMEPPSGGFGEIVQSASASRTAPG